MTRSGPSRIGQKTYWHLGKERRVPTKYEVASSRLRYSVTHPPVIDTPAIAWQALHARSSLRCEDWDVFADPAETTYSEYVTRARERDAFVEQSIRDEIQRGASPSPRWRAEAARLLAVLRYPIHGLQMCAAYLGSAAPAGRITQAALYQAADEVRRIHWFAHHIALARLEQADVARDAKDRWQTRPAWQPLRRVVERLLLAYGFDECFAALNLVVKPCFDALTVSRFGEIARERGDVALAALLGSLDEECRQQRRWSRQLLLVLGSADAENLPRLRAHAERWRDDTCDALCSIAADAGFANGANELAELREGLTHASGTLLHDKAGADDRKQAV
jgi:toluene monooxygenase system protein E